MPLYLTEADVAGLITAGEAVPVLEACFRRMAAGAVENVPRRRLALEDGSFAVMYAVDRELGYAGVKAYTVAAGRAVFAVSLFDFDTGELAAVLEADDANAIQMPGALPGVTIVHSAGEDAAVLLADEVPLPEGDNVYELWEIRDGPPYGSTSRYSLTSHSVTSAQ